MAPRRDVMFIAKKYTFVLLRVFRYSQRMTRFRSKIRALLDLFNIQAFFSALQINVIILLQYIDVKSVNMSETSGWISPRIFVPATGVFIVKLNIK